jgi:plastocyanin
MKKRSTLSTLVVIAALTLVACGGGDDNGTEATTPANGGGGGAGATLKLSADPSGALKFDTDQLSAQAGNVTIEFDNPAGLGHDVVVEQDGKEIARTPVISESSSELSTDLEPGSYTYYCSVPGHREGGMEGTLTVK